MCCLLVEIINRHGFAYNTSESEDPDDQSHQIYTSPSALVRTSLYIKQINALCGHVRARIEFRHKFVCSQVEPSFVLIKCFSSRSPFLLLSRPVTPTVGDHGIMVYNVKNIALVTTSCPLELLNAVVFLTKVTKMLYTIKNNETNALRGSETFVHRT